MNIKKIILFALVICISYSSLAQWRPNGASNLWPTEDPANFYYGGINALPANMAQYDYPLNVTIMDNGNGWNQNDIKNAFYTQLDDANLHFAPINMRFLVYNSFHYETNQTNNFSVNDLQVQATNLPNYNQNAINVYIVEDANLSGTAIGGFATYPWLKGYRDVVILKRSVLLNQDQILTHEFGHFFGLYHTFGAISLVAADDYIPDTQWDPNTGNPGLACANPHNPENPRNNVMSYNLGCNSKSFSPQQLRLMREIATTSQNNNGRQDDFSAACQNLNINLTSLNNIPGNNDAKHIIKTSRNLTINGNILNAKLIVEASSITVINGTLRENLNLGGAPCNNMPNRPAPYSEPEFKPITVSENRFNIYPNPTNGSFKIRSETALPSEIDLTIRSITGSVITKKHITIIGSKNESGGIDIINLNPGIYLIEILDVERKLAYSKKLIVQ